MVCITFLERATQGPRPLDRKGCQAAVAARHAVFRRSLVTESYRGFHVGLTVSKSFGSGALAEICDRGPTGPADSFVIIGWRCLIQNAVQVDGFL